MIPILKKFWKEIALLLMLILLSLSVRQCSQNADSIKVLHSSTDSLKYYKLKDGRTAAQGEVDALTIKQLKEFGGQLGFDNQQLKQQIGKLSNLVAHWKGKAGMRDTVEIPLRDTIIVEVDGTDDAELTFSYSNKYLFLDGIINEGNLSLSYKYNTEFTLTAYRKSPGLFRSKILVADLVFKDPNMQTTEFKGLVIKEPKKTFWQTTGGKLLIGFTAGVTTYSLLK